MTRSTNCWDCINENSELLAVLFIMVLLVLYDLLK